MTSTFEWQVRWKWKNEHTPGFAKVATEEHAGRIRQEVLDENADDTLEWVTLERRETVVGDWEVMSDQTYLSMDVMRSAVGLDDIPHYVEEYKKKFGSKEE